MTLTPETILTRPAQESPSWVEGLVDAGIGVVHWPLIEIKSVDLDEAKLDTLRKIKDFAALVFVSSSAVDHFFTQLMRVGEPALPSVKCWATGLGTAKTLQKHGIDPRQIVSPPTNAPQFDSPQLWEVGKGSVKAGDQVLFIRGIDQANPNNPPSQTELLMHKEPTGSQWLISELTRHGILVREIVVYQRCAPVWSDVQLQLAQEALQAGSVWIFSSSLSVQNLAQLLPHQSWTKGRALATHGRIAQCALDMGWGVVQVSRPTLSDVLTSLKYFK